MTDEPGLSPRPRRSTRRRNRAQTTELIKNALEAGATRGASALNAGITRATFYEWMNTDPTFLTVVEAAEAMAEVGYVAVIRRAALGDLANKVSPDWRAAAWWLERRRHEDFRRRDRIDLVQAVRDLARSAGLDEEEEAEAVREAERMLREGMGVGTRPTNE